MHVLKVCGASLRGFIRFAPQGSFHRRLSDILIVWHSYAANKTPVWSSAKTNVSKIATKKNAFYIIFKTDMYLIIKRRVEEKELI